MQWQWRNSNGDNETATMTPQQCNNKGDTAMVTMKPQRCDSEGMAMMQQ